jgi:hypothetical protein
MRVVLLVGTALLAGSSVTLGKAQQQEPITGSWNARFTPERVTLQLSVQFDGTRSVRDDDTRSGSSTYSFRVRPEEIRNRTRNADPGGAARTSFQIVREAGAFIFEGREDERRGSGWFRFEPSAAYIAQMRSLGFTDLAGKPVFVFGVQDLTLARVRQLKTLVADPLDTPTLVRMSDHGADAEYVSALATLGYRGLGARALVRAVDHGVTPEYIREMRGEGHQLTLDELVRAVDHGVDAEFARDMKRLGSDAALTIEELVRARDHGVSSDFVEEMRALGYRVGMDQLIRARDHGVDVSFVKKLAEAGYKDVPLQSLVRLRDHGVTPAFVRDMSALGYTSLRPEDLTRLRDHGVTPGFIRRMREAGYKDLTIDRLIRLRQRGED